MKRFLVAALATLIATSAYGYIPRSRTVLEKTSKAHGRGIYQIQLELSFRSDTLPYLVTETWTVENGDSLSMQARGSGFKLTRLYKNNLRHTLGTQSKATPISSEFFEGLFHFRGTETFIQFMAKHHILPTKNISRESRPKNMKELNYPKEPWIRLARTGGVVAYAFGTPTPAGSKELLPGLWIEQDKFHIRKFRTPKGTEVVAEDYNEYSRNLHFPQTRVVSWNGHQVVLRAVKVTALRNSNEVKARLTLEGLKKQNKDEYEVPSDLLPVVQDFYTNLR